MLEYDMEKKEFIEIVKRYYNEHKRLLPWREFIVPYHVVLSEIMLQQTQVARIMEKFPLFIKRFPTFRTLHESSLVDVLGEWQGMGYNRRGKYIKEIATIIHTKYQDIVPDDSKILDELPGIGHATASAIVTYIYNKPEIFIETNIRRVFIHHFFKDSKEVEDSDILPLVQETVDRENPREWYYAIMDYGTYLSKIVENPNRKSKHFKKQSQFEGSVRQVRGEILRLLLKKRIIKKKDLYTLLPYEESKCKIAAEDLLKEGMIGEAKGEYHITEK
jgi:A/G-specific adenine glycosylase